MLACVRTSEPPVVPAVERYCHICAHPVWVSAAMVRHVDSGEYPAVCLECVPGVMATGQYLMKVHPDQESDLRSLGILGQMRSLVNQINRISLGKDR